MIRELFSTLLTKEVKEKAKDAEPATLPSGTDKEKSDQECSLPTKSIDTEHGASDTSTSPSKADLSAEGQESAPTSLADHVREALKKVEDPEIHIDVITLNLIYEIKVEDGACKVLMTFTTPLCPFGPALMDEVKRAAESVEGISNADVKVTFTPPWEPTPEVKMMLGI